MPVSPDSARSIFPGLVISACFPHLTTLTNTPTCRFSDGASRRLWHAVVRHAGFHKLIQKFIERKLISERIAELKVPDGSRYCLDLANIRAETFSKIVASLNALRLES